jgi:agmatinase
MNEPELRYQLVPNRPLPEADVIVLPVPHELTVSYRHGTRNGPEAILEATAQLEYYEEDGRWSPLRHMGICVLPPCEKRLHEDVAGFHQRLAREVSELPARPLLLALGGEHSITPSLVSGRMAEPGTVVLLDAHADLRGTYEGSVHSHACPMHHVREQGHRIVMAGIRSLYEQEAARIEADAAIDCYLDRELQRGGRWDDLIAQLRGLSGPVWLTIDMDAFNPAEVAGVGTPQPGGLSWYQALEIIEVVTLNEAVDLRGADILELVPEPSCVSDMTAAKLTQKIISGWGRRHGYPQRPETGSQTEVSYE